MRDLLLLISVRFRIIRHGAREFLGSSRLRVTVVIGLVVFFWLLMFAMFYDAFRFLHGGFLGISGILIEYLFAFLFVSLLVMMAISDAIIAYASLYRSGETEFLHSLPLRAENTFAYRGADSMVFSLWGVGTLVIPMVLAYAAIFPTTWYFLPFALALSVLFILFATELGAFFALVVGLFLPRGHRKALIGLAVAAVGAAVLWGVPIGAKLQESKFNEAGIRYVINQISFCQHWALPSHWVSRGMLAAAHGDLSEAAFLTALLLANVLFLGMVTYRFAFYGYRLSWCASRGMSRRSLRGPESVFWKAVEGALLPLPLRLRQLVLKDMKTFLRDPSQWSQFLLFFGLLALYVLNLPRFNLDQLQPYWHSMIALLNLGAACLTLATLTTRFVFPQLSLEGRRIWILGLLPLERKVILWGKFLFATAGTFLISGTLIALSDLFLKLPLWALAAHLVVTLCVCCGLNGLAVGLGALYPQLGTDNPSKIVSSFGGTLNLICSICFIALAAAPVVAPLHLKMIGKLEGAPFALGIGAGLGVVAVVAALATLIPMLAGARAFARMEF